MTMQLFSALRSSLAALLLLAGLAATPALAVDLSDRQLGADLADDVATGMIQTYEAANKDAGFEAFEKLFETFQGVGKWQAFVDAIDAAKLPTGTGPYAEIRAALDRLKAASIDRDTLAGAALDALAGLGMWHVASDAQAELVIQHLGMLVTELSDPRQRLTGQLLLARVELEGDTPLAAVSRFVEGISDIARLQQSELQLQFAREFGATLLPLDAPHTLEIVSELLAVIHKPEDRATLVGEWTTAFTGESARRIAAVSGIKSGAPTSDPLAAAWALHAGPAAPTIAAVLELARDDIDPLPALIALSAGVPPAQRLEFCSTLVNDLVAGGHALRALNLRKQLDPADCGPDTQLLLAQNFADSHFVGLAGPLMAEFLGAVAAGTTAPTPEQWQQAERIIEAIGDLSLLAAHGDLLQAALGAEAYTGLAARTVVSGLLLDRQSRGKPLDPSAQTLVAAHAPAALMLSLLTGEDVAAAATTASPQDLALFRKVGAALAQVPDAELRLTHMMDGTAALPERLAAAAGYTSNLSFGAASAHGDALQAALRALAAAALPEDLAASRPDQRALLASLGLLDPSANFVSADLLLRGARHRAWAGDFTAAKSLATMIGNPSTAKQLLLDVDAIAAVVGDFETGVAALRASDDLVNRVAALRFVAYQRARLLDSKGWIDGGVAAEAEVPAELINASLPVEGDGPVIYYDKHVSVRPSGVSHPIPTPPMPDLTIGTIDVARRVPFPGGGVAGIVDGGEGRYVRLGGFDSPYFDGESNNGVRDYVYEQNATITPEFIFLNSGVFTIADVIAAIGRDQAGAVDLLPDGVVRFNRPVAIGPDATLILSGQEAREIQLNSTTGAFIVNAGHLNVIDTRIVSFDTETQQVTRRGNEEAMHKFRPFILGWSDSETNLADSEFVALGYSAGRSYGLTLNSGPVDEYYYRANPAAPTGTIVNNSFDNLYYGFYSYEAADVQLIGNEYRNSVIYGIDPHDRSIRLNISLNTSYGAMKKHGIIISREVNDSFIVGNLSFDNHGSGVMLDRSNIGTLVFANTLRSNHGDGMSVFESPCTIVGMNDVSLNARAGIKVRNSWDVLLLQNLIAGNKGSAIEGFISDLANAEGSTGRNFALDPYQPFTSFVAMNNAMQGNAAGIQTAGVSELELLGNQFRHQSGRLLAGDLDGLDGILLQKSNQKAVTVSSNCRPVLQPLHACLWAEYGLQVGQRFESSERGDFCLGDSGTTQAQAFGGASQ